MFGLGFWEIVIIVVAVFIFIKPKDLPKLFRKVGNLFRKISNFNSNITDMFRGIETEIKSQIDIDEISSDTEIKKDKD